MKKSRSNSAFFILCRAVLLAAIMACTVFLMEVFFLGLMPVIESQLTNPPMWILPGIVFVFVFLWCLIRSGMLRTFLVLGIIGGIVCSLYVQGPALTSTLVSTFIDSKIDLERYVQADDPEFANTYLLRQNPFPIFYVDDGNLEQTIPQSTLDALTAYIADLPAVLLDNCSAMYLMEEKAFEDMDPSYENSIVFGLSKSSNFTVDIRLVSDGSSSYTYMHSGQPVTLDNPVFYTETIVHELVHLFDMKSASRGALYSESDPFIAWYQSSPELFGSYGGTSPAEWFAEAGVYYFMYPDLLQMMSADIYQALDTVFSSPGV